jgi:lipopolysaccharide transport system permease protein
MISHVMSASRTTVIEPSRGLRPLRLIELWEYRSLIISLLIRNLQVRYAQSVLGIAWSVVRPLMAMGVLTTIFERFARLPSDGHPYAVFSLAAVVPWIFFSTSLTGACESLTGNGGMITKVYFPRLALPITNVLAPLADFTIGLVLLLAMILWFGLTPSISSAIVIPALVLTMMLTAMGIGCFVAAIDVQYRDAARLVPFVLQLWMYASPIVYPMSIVPQRYRQLYALNPMAGVIETFRSVLLGTRPIDWGPCATAMAVSAMACLAGMIYFKQRERIFADVV